MKIEKINDSQIRCTLSKADLENREIKISELVYGSDKTKDLFRDMMEQASEEFGFNANDIPLMIEAIPLETGSILLIITKVTDPEELDTRFSNFSPSIHKQSEDKDASSGDLPDSSDVADLFRKIKELSEAAKNEADGQPVSKEDVAAPKATEHPLPDKEKEVVSCAYTFDSINVLIKIAQRLNDSYKGNNSLYKNTSDNIYYLVIHSKSDDAENFKKLSAVLSEYGELKPSIYGCTAWVEEHNNLIIKDNALHELM